MEYLNAFSAEIVGTIVVAFPLLFSTVVALYPGQRPTKKILFVIFCSVLAYGIAMLVTVLLLPFEFVTMFYAPGWEDQGATVLPLIFATITRSTDLVAVALGSIVAIVAPVYLRRGRWEKIIENLA